MASSLIRPHLTVNSQGSTPRDFLRPSLLLGNLPGSASGSATTRALRCDARSKKVWLRAAGGRRCCVACVAQGFEVVNLGVVGTLRLRGGVAVCVCFCACLSVCVSVCMQTQKRADAIDTIHVSIQPIGRYIAKPNLP